MEPSNASTTTDWIVAIATSFTALGVIIAVIAYFTSRTQLKLTQLQVAISVRGTWDSSHHDIQRALAVMTWFVFPKGEGCSSWPFLKSENELDLARRTAFGLAYHTDGEEQLFEAATRRFYGRLYELSSLKADNLLTTELIYTYFGREIIRHWSAIRGFVNHWPPSDNFPQQRTAIDDLLQELHIERCRRKDVRQATKRAWSNVRTMPPVDPAALLRLRDEIYLNDLDGLEEIQTSPQPTIWHRLEQLRAVATRALNRTPGRQDPLT